uniref:Uncharacterized protein n=1 Tax=Anguilla anguilla TaxID=7936 RepID=A0A0E9R3Y7_ANGAN
MRLIPPTGELPAKPSPCCESKCVSPQRKHSVKGEIWNFWS